MLRRMSSRVSRNDDADYRPKRGDDVDNRTRGGVSNQGFDSFGVGQPTYETVGNNNRDNGRGNSRGNSRDNNRGVDNRGYLASGAGMLNFGSTDFKAPNGDAPNGNERVATAGRTPASPEYENVSLNSVKPPSYSTQMSTQQKPENSSGKMLKVIVGIGFVVLLAAIAVAAIILHLKIQNNDDLMKDMNTTIVDLQSQVRQIASENIQLKQQQSNNANDLTTFRSSTTSDLTDLRSFEVNISKHTEDVKKVGQFAFKGLEFGQSRGSDGSVFLDHECKLDGSPDVFGCLLFCYNLRVNDSAVDGAVIQKDSDSCCCEKNTKTTVSNAGFLHYVLTYFEE